MLIKLVILNVVLALFAGSFWVLLHRKYPLLKRRNFGIEEKGLFWLSLVVNGLLTLMIPVILGIFFFYGIQSDTGILFSLIELKTEVFVPMALMLLISFLAILWLDGFRPSMYR
ncbi:MAG: hypothetical protein OXR68_06210 [Alphaproteobacteria bacterium]|nr:hypothetical protein [Alphaproteobacteria bacterium]MDD9920199.1 hypothetical protein [Alphaproteobacteria bacterium]